jgi:glutamate racemase
VIDDRAIGVFDSGVGGLTVLRAIHDRYPDQRTIYVGDLAAFPYGPKPRSVVQARALAMAGYLDSRDIKALVIACNTATSAALDEITHAARCPVIGVVEPGARAALSLSATQTIGVAATEGTVQSGAYSRAIRSISHNARVFEVSCGELVDLIETGESHSPAVKSIVAGVVDNLVRGQGCDTIILGCTHFPLVKREFQRAAGDSIAVLDSADATAKVLAEALNGSIDIVAPDKGQLLIHEFLVTAHADAFVSQARTLFGEHITASVVEIDQLGRSALSMAAAAQSSP